MAFFRDHLFLNPWTQGLTGQPRVVTTAEGCRKLWPPNPTMELHAMGSEGRDTYQQLL